MSKKVTFMHRKNYKNPINTTVRIAFLIEDCHHLLFIQIKRAMGLVRGKNDAIDSKPISEYAYLRRASLVPSKLPAKIIRKLKNILTLR